MKFGGSNYTVRTRHSPKTSMFMSTGDSKLSIGVRVCVCEREDEVCMCVSRKYFPACV